MSASSTRNRLGCARCKPSRGTEQGGRTAASPSSDDPPRGSSRRDDAGRSQAPDAIPVQLRPLTVACVLGAATAALAAGCGGGGSDSTSGAATAAAVASTNFCPSVDALAGSVASAQKLDPK